MVVPECQMAAVSFFCLGFHITPSVTQACGQRGTPPSGDPATLSHYNRPTNVSQCILSHKTAVGKSTVRQACASARGHDQITQTVELNQNVACGHLMPVSPGAHAARQVHKTGRPHEASRGIPWAIVSDPVLHPAQTAYSHEGIS